MKWMYLLPAAGMLALTACGSAPANSEVTTAAAQTTAAETTASAVTETTAVSTMQTVSAASTAAAETTQPAVTSQTDATMTGSVTVTYATAAFVPVYTFTTVEEKREQGGEGGEEHAQDIDPLYFNYLFGDDEAALRLAGGTYQVLSYDFSEALENDVESKYYLADVDFDGDLDLCVPVHFANSNEEQAVFLWNAETLHYAEEPVMLMNPVIREERKDILCIEHVSANKSILTRYGWEDGKIRTLESASADFAMLTYVYTDAAGKKDIQKLESADEVRTRMDAFIK